VSKKRAHQETHIFSTSTMMTTPLRRTPSHTFTPSHSVNMLEIGKGGRFKELETALNDPQVSEEERHAFLRYEQPSITSDALPSAPTHSTVFFPIKKEGNGCLHGTGLELFGEVFES
jgi:hypothetical protein